MLDSWKREIQIAPTLLDQIEVEECMLQVGPQTSEVIDYFAFLASLIEDLQSSIFLFTLLHRLSYI